MSTHSTLSCPQCREPIPAVLKDFKIAGCLVCGQVSTLSKDGQMKVTHRSPVVKRVEQDPFYLGTQIQHRKITYTVASVFVYAVDYQEWDSENSKWVKDKGYIKEWYAYDDQQDQTLIIMKDTDGKFYHVSNPVPVKLDAPFDKKNTIEFGQYQLWGFAGTDDETIEIKGHYCNYGHYSLECVNEKFENAPVVKYQLARLYPTQVKRMMVLEEVEKLKATEDFEMMTYCRNLFGFALLAILILQIFNWTTNVGKVQTSEYVKFAAKFTAGWPDTAVFKPQLAGTFYLIADKNYRFTAKCYLSETNQSVDYSLTMVRLQDAVVVNDVALSFYTESGRDNDGYWEENLLYDHFKFQVDKTGKYQIFVAPDYENLWPFPSASLELQIKPTSYSTFYLCTGAVFLLLLLMFQWQRENLIAFANLPHDTILHDFYESFE